ncbi:unnamed protein product [Mytilus edulis]|uniref:Uncharacterized protein n=1 Tax=Mytilus edulis TaxID=6550 RepID=A0A8S3SIV3_MYTED|nr:unnamed protein product [Mytilus edulis]
MMEILKSKENEIEVLKECGSNKQLFIALRKQVSDVQTAANKVQQMISSSQEVDISLDEYKNVKMKCFGSFRPRSWQNQPIGFEKDTDLRCNAICNLVDVAITEDNKLLLTNYIGSNQKLYVYRECKEYEGEITFTSDPRGVAVIAGSDRAVVTLLNDKYIQFINTKQMKKEVKVNVKFECIAVSAGRDNIYVSGNNGTIKTLDTNGTILQSINHGETDIYFLLYDNIHEQLIVRFDNKLSCVKLDGTLVFSMDVSGRAGVTFDRQGDIYFGNYHTNNIQRISPDGENCEQMLNQDNGIHYPKGMCFNNDFTKLFVVNNDCQGCSSDSRIIGYYYLNGFREFM